MRINIHGIFLLGVVSILTSQKTNSARAAYGNCSIMVLVHGSLLNEILLNIRHVIQRVKASILIISKDENDIGLLSSSMIFNRCTEWNCSDAWKEHSRQPKCFHLRNSRERRARCSAIPVVSLLKGENIHTTDWANGAIPCTLGVARWHQVVGALMIVTISVAQSRHFFVIQVNNLLSMIIPSKARVTSW